MKIYIDFDGVILDTDNTIDNIVKKVNVNKKDYIKNCDWNQLLDNTSIINDSLKYLKKTKQDINLLSKISTLDEGIAKIKYLRKNNVCMNVNLVPAAISKSEIVNPKGNILVDDKVYNLDEWNCKGGISLFFSKDNKDVDIYGKLNTKYKKINNLGFLINDNS